MKVIPISLTLRQLKELCERRMTEIVLQSGRAVIRIVVNLDDPAQPC
jgi:hypothetical protein